MKKRPVKRRKPPLISHHSKTGKRLHRRHTSYPLLVLVVAIVGVFMIGLTLQVKADDVAVSAVVDGPPPSAPATILSPSDNARFSSTPITVSGTCPAGGGNMVKLYRNNLFSGAVLCAFGGTFQLQTDLFAGSNTLIARIFNAANVEGPTSPGVAVYYDAPPDEIPSPGSTGSSGNGSPSADGIQLIIKADNLYKGYYTGDSIEWRLEALGGTPPYAFTVDWGDNTTSTISRKEAGEFIIKHIYDKPGAANGSYVIQIHGSDSTGETTFLQLMVIVHDKDNIAYAAPGFGLTGETPPLNLPFHLSYIWPAYAITLLTVGSFWLGGHRRLLHLKIPLKIHKV